MTSRGVFPKTLAAPAIAPNSPVIKGLMALLGSSPRRQKKKKKQKEFVFVFFTAFLFASSGCKCIDSLTFVPVS